ncbi:MAG: group II intron reverse transcriptase/maturase [Sarcina sp.]
MKENILEKRQSLRNNEYYWLQPTFDKLYVESKNGKKFKDLMEIIMEENNIKLAYRNIKKNGGSKTAGTDGLTIEDVEKLETDKFISRIQDKLKNYQPKSVKRVMIPKPNGKLRPLGIPCIEDRIIQQAIRQVLEPICEAKFHKHSYGFRPNRSTHHALSRAMYLINHTKTYYVVDVDIKGFFDNVDHPKLLKQLWTLGIQDKNLLMVIKKILKSEIKGEGIPSKGTPQGGVISPLLSNVVLNELDWWLSSQWESFETKHDYGKLRKANTPQEYVDQSHKFRALRTRKLKEIWHVRYADDFKIFCKDYETACKMYIAVKDWLKERLKLDISPEKSKVTNIMKNRTEFLGLMLKVKPKKKKSYVCKSNICKKAQQTIMKKLKDQIKVIQKTQSGVEAIRYNSMVLGMHNYYKVASNCNIDFGKIDHSLLKTKQLRLKEYKGWRPNFSATFKKLYKRYMGATIYTVMDVSLFPIYGIINQPPVSFTQSLCNYTKEGREALHRNVNGNIAMLINYLLNRRMHSNEIELFDNSISLMSGQRGLCAVTKEPLEVGDMELHHKIPSKLGGSNKYSNLVWLSKEIHKMVHATDGNIIKQFMAKYIINGKTIEDEPLSRLNKLRVLVGNEIL